MADGSAWSVGGKQRAFVTPELVYHQTRRVTFREYRSDGAHSAYRIYGVITHGGKRVVSRIGEHVAATRCRATRRHPRRRATSMFACNDAAMDRQDGRRDM